MDLGTVTTGSTLQPAFGGIVDGNAEANRAPFDSGVVTAAIPEGSRLRNRWAADAEAQSDGWVFGLDNVSLSLFTEGVNSPQASVPEPSALLLTFIGLALVGQLQRRS